jgi:glycosyltransferase involved in cell wall biosynthesis
MSPIDPRPLVSIVIPCYRQAHLLGEAIDGALAQTYPHVEVLVVDDGSPDDVGAVVDLRPGVRLVRQPNAGVSAARNSGARASRGEYLVFLDADDLLLPPAVDVGMQTFAERPECAFVHGAAERRRLDGTAVPDANRVVVGAPDLYLELLRTRSFQNIAAAVFRRDAFEAVGGFDETSRHGEDWDLSLRLARRYPAYGHGRVVAVYRRTGQNTNSVRNANAMLRGTLRVLDAQRRYTRGNREYEAARRAAVRRTKEVWRNALFERVRDHARSGRWRAALADAALLLRHYPAAVARQAIRKLLPRGAASTPPSADGGTRR